jgi:anti-sigma factor RsiW
MTATDPYAHSDGAYVLGVLDDDDRRAFEAHLATCPECQARVAELQETAALLSLLPRSDDELLVPDVGAEPDTLLPGLLRRARSERRRRRWVAGAVGALAAACVIALAIVLWPGGGSSSQERPPAQALVALQPNPLTVTARLTPRAWGTQIELHCSYPAYDRDNLAYDLVVVDRGNRSHAAGDWRLVPGKDGINFTSGTSVPAAQIARLQVRAPSGTPLLELRR